MRDNTVCSFCQELANKDYNNFFELYLKDKFNKAGLQSRIIGETKYFVVFPMVGPLVPGYLLVLPKRHVESISMLTEHELEELYVVKNEIQCIFVKYFGESIVYEHGALTSTLRGGCCSDHAHLHIVAIDVDVSDTLRKNFEVRYLSDLRHISEQLEQHSPYLYYEDKKGQCLIMNVGIVESQYIRKLLASQIGDVEHVFWNNNIEYDWMINIVKLLKPEFEGRRGNGLWL